VDAAGDQHDFTRFAKSLLPSHQKRYAGVVLDVYSDYLLILVWDQVMEEPLPSVLSDIHDLLRTPLLPLPPTAARTASALLNYRILESYADADNLPGMVDRIGTRLRRPVSLSSLLFSLQRHEPELLDRFIDYYADMQQVANP
jgi:acyl carrier protein phosphodiesterase